MFFFFVWHFFFLKKKKTYKILINYLGALTICSQASAGLIIQADHQTCSLIFFSVGIRVHMATDP